MLKKIFAIAIFVVLSQSLFATEVRMGKITKIDFGKNYGNFVFIQLDSLQEGRIGCHVNGSWNYTHPIETEMDKAILSGLLSAYMSNSKVSIWGAGVCGQFSSIETLRNLRLEK